MRDYSRIDKYIDQLHLDVYPQPPDNGHTELAVKAINQFHIWTSGSVSVLDLGCGEGFCQPIFEELGYTWEGVCLQQDYVNAKAAGRNVKEFDFTFLPYKDESFDILFSRHSLEHSPIPLMTLFEWHRIAKKYLALVLPAQEYWGIGGRNHYFVLNRKQWEWMFEVAGFDIKFSGAKYEYLRPLQGYEEIEYWFLLEKKDDSVQP